MTKKTFSLAVILLLVISLPLTVLISQQQQENRQNAASPVSTYPANVDFAAGNYGQYVAADLTNPNIAATDVEMYWASVEPTQGQIDFAPLDKELADWGSHGKKVILVLRFANEVGGGCPGGYLPSWEIARIPTFCDTDLNNTIPDYFNPTFQADWKTFVKAVGDHVGQSQYKNSVEYVRAGVGLAGEGFYLTYQQNDLPTDLAKLVAWGYSASAWQNFQESMMTYYKSVFPYAPVIYPIVKLDNDSQVQTAEWAVDNGMGIGQQGIVPGDYPTDYAKMREITAYARAHHAYIQYQTLSGVGSATEVQGIIKTAQDLGGMSIEWYESITNDPSYQSLFAGWQQYVTTTYGNQQSPSIIPGTPQPTSATNTPIPNISGIPVPITGSAGTTPLSVTICPHGLGNCGDNANPASGGNSTPQQTTRPVTVTLLDANNQLAGTGQGNVTYNPSAQNFQGTISINNLSSGSYLVTVKMAGYLSKQLPGIQTITANQTTTLPSVSLTAGDINNDNQLDILDYNLLISCFGSKATTSSCQNKTAADITDDGTVDGADYNLFLRELSVQQGSGGGAPTPVPTTIGSGPTPTQSPVGTGTDCKAFPSIPCGLLPSPAAPAPNPTPPPDATQFTVQQNITYTTGYALDLYTPQPAPTSKLPVVLYFHGLPGSKAEINAKLDDRKYMLEALLTGGYKVASMDYPVVLPPQTDTAISAKAAVRFLRANAAQYNIDPDRIVAWGLSAGGIPVTVLGTADQTAGFDVGNNLNVSSKVAAVIDWYGDTYLVKPSYITANASPMLIQHGQKDGNVSPTTSQTIFDEFTKAGAFVELEWIQNAGHHFGSNGGPINPDLTDITKTAVTFLNAVVKNNPNPVH